MIIDEEVYLETEVSDFLAHYGVKGMRWGVRRTKRIQNILDRHQRIAKGTASTKDKLLGANRLVFTKKGARKNLEKGAYHQERILKGRGFTKALLKAQAVNIGDLNYHTEKTAAGRAKFEKARKRGKIVAGGILVTYGAFKVADVLWGGPPKQPAAW
jgi:hypothetical protein